MSVRAATLRDLREAAGMTQQEAAEALGMTRPRLSNYERGKSEPRIEVMRRLAEVYGCSLDVVFAAVAGFESKEQG